MCTEIKIHIKRESRTPEEIAKLADQLSLEMGKKLIEAMGKSYWKWGGKL